ncbi:hypothetical protein BDN70DRAFT_183129 [Pholiota conissans]|uniref:Uncharacterized protein n=1 Tax=Pholiota conissans TaxID=109636 RepID=A0A9P6CRJ9_9AGAR|nr:hypothetical protein BDN70DRAFT_183129 [Pholiota conissans]
MCFGYVVPCKDLIACAKKTWHWKELNGHVYGAYGCQNACTLFCDWSLDEPVIGIATNTSRENMTLNTPENVEALKTVLERTDDPQWIRLAI